jgi:protein-S-isoprenylcysteine O-methyltransferase Ste14
MTPKLILLYLLSEFLSLFGMAVFLFWSAGQLDWWTGWAVIAVMVVCLTMVGFVIFRFQPGLLAERLAPPKGAKPWDRALVSLIRLAQLARYILGGLDQRYSWTGGFPLVVQIAAIVLCILGYALFAWALASNSYFSQIVRIQSDRGHAVATSGPYRYVRHPGYTGMILFELAMATLLASWWALLAGGVCAILLILRTSLEDRTLQAELPGYVDYARRVRYRLFPDLW